MISAKLKSLTQGLSGKKHLNELVAHIIQNPKEINDLFKLYFGSSSRQKSFISWSLGHLAEKAPELLYPFHDAMIKELDSTNLKAVKRNFTRAFRFSKVQKENHGRLYDCCFCFITDNNESIAVRAFSILICQELCMTYPDLKRELIIVLRSIIPNGSSGLKHRAKEGIKLLSKSFP